MSMNETFLKDKYNEYVRRHKRKYNHQRGNHSALRDSQQSKCYKAEWKWMKEFPEHSTAMSKKDAEKYFKRVQKSKLWQSEGWPVVLEFMKDMGSHTRMNGYAHDGLVRKVRLAPQGSSKYTILHELTHCMGYWNHDRMFRISLVKMVSRFLGQKEAKYLKQMFKDQGLKMTKPRKVMTYEQWVEKYKRLVEE